MRLEFLHTFMWVSNLLARKTSAKPASTAWIGKHGSMFCCAVFLLENSDIATLLHAIYKSLRLNISEYTNFISTSVN